MLCPFDLFCTFCFVLGLARLVLCFVLHCSLEFSSPVVRGLQLAYSVYFHSWAPSSFTSFFFFIYYHYYWCIFKQIKINVFFYTTSNSLIASLNEQTCVSLECSMGLWAVTQGSQLKRKKTKQNVILLIIQPLALLPPHDCIKTIPLM